MLNYDSDTGKMSIIAKDTGDFIFSLDNYILDDGDKVTFTVNTELELSTAKLQKVYTSFSDGKCIIHLTKEDTDLEPGTYYYDIQVDTADGRTDTVMGPAKFKVNGGVTY
jgi:hypothetical protein